MNPLFIKSMQFQPNQIIAEKYTMEKKLGEGGIATVYKMRHIQLDTPFALKILKVSTPSLKERLELEAKVQAQIRHPNIVSVLDVIREEHFIGLLMEFVDGTGLDDFLEREELSQAEVEQIFIEILEGMEEAHEHSIVHRDLKPGNVMINRKRGRFQIKICDFGLAKALDDEGASKTVSGTTMGTPAYMSPEQIRNSKNVDERADIFSLGVMLYEMLSGQRPFSGSTNMDIMTSIVKKEPEPIEKLMPNIPLRYVNAVNGALEKQRDQRISTCSEFRAILLGEKTLVKEKTDSFIMEGFDLMSGEFSRDLLQEELAEKKELLDDDLQQFQKKPKGEEVSLYEVSGAIKKPKIEQPAIPKDQLDDLQQFRKKPKGEEVSLYEVSGVVNKPKIEAPAESIPEPIREQNPTSEAPKKNNLALFGVLGLLLIGGGVFAFSQMNNDENQEVDHGNQTPKIEKTISQKEQDVIQEPETISKEKPVQEEIVEPKKEVKEPPKTPEKTTSVVTNETKTIATQEAVKEPQKENLKKLDTEEAKKIVAQFDRKTRNSSRIKECFAAEQKISGSAPKRVPLIITLANTGKVTSVKISDGEYVDSSFEGCLQKKLKSLTYQKFDEGTKPLKFRYTLKS